MDATYRNGKYQINFSHKKAQSDFTGLWVAFCFTWIALPEVLLRIRIAKELKNLKEEHRGNHMSSLPFIGADFIKKCMWTKPERFKSVMEHESK